jgi:hypothetical protein
LLAAGVDGVGLIAIDIVDGKNSIIMNEAGEIVKDDDNASVEPYPFDFCMISAETVGWLNHNAHELAYRRNLLAPRKPSPDEANRICNGCEGAGCNHCQGTGLCTSRCQSFEDWAANCLGQEQKTKLGSGYILRETSISKMRFTAAKAEVMAGNSMEIPATQMASATRAVSAILMDTGIKTMVVRTVAPATQEIQRRLQVPTN